MAQELTVVINGEEHTSRVDGRTLLVHYLRDQCLLTGTHVGCDTSSCGACTILLDGKSIKSCTMLAAQVDGCNITTIEGLADGDDLHPLQEAFKEEHGLQCGFCTPGMIMSACDLLAHNPNPTEQEIREGIEGNICRCTGYHNIVRSIQLAALKMQERELTHV